MWFSPPSPDPVRIDQLGTYQGRSRRRASARRATSVPHLEALEVRSLLSLLTVTSSADSGPGSLRKAIAKSGKGDTIEFAKTVHNITLTSGALQVPHDLDVEGPGADRLTVSGNNASRVFEVGGGAVVTLAGLTVANGRADQGGGIDNAGNLTLDHCTVANNQSIGGAGGSGGSDGDGDGVGGGVYVYDLGIFIPISTVIKKNKASTSHEDVFNGH